MAELKEEVLTFTETVETASNEAKNDFSQATTRYTKEQVINILKSRKMINEPGRYTVKCFTVNEATDLEKPSKMISFAVMTPSLVKQAKEALESADYGKALNFQMLHRKFYNNGKISGYVPENGELCNIDVELVDAKNGRTLGITAISQIKAVSAGNCSNLF
jgi:hypothetical protein